MCSPDCRCRIWKLCPWQLLAGPHTTLSRSPLAKHPLVALAPPHGRCREAGICHCTGEGRRLQTLRGQLLTNMKATFHTTGLKDLLHTGGVFLRFVPHDLSSTLGPARPHASHLYDVLVSIQTHFHGGCRPGKTAWRGSSCTDHGLGLSSLTVLHRADLACW